MLWLDVPFWHVLLLFIIKLVFLSFSFLFWRSIKFPQQDICKLKTGIGHQKLSVELYAIFPRNKSLNQQLSYVPWNRYGIIDKILEMYSRRRSSNIENCNFITNELDPDSNPKRSWSHLDQILVSKDSDQTVSYLS